MNGNREHHDVIVVGARCAGASTAMLLARSGHDVLMVDRADLPRDTLSTHSLVRGGVVQLSRWGLLDDVVASGAPPVRSAWFHEYGPGASTPVRRAVKERFGVDMVLAPRRYVLDEILADAAVAAGAELRTRTTVTGVLRDTRGRAVGVTTRQSDGSTADVTARLVVGADGVRSRMARRFGARTLEAHRPAGPCFYAYVDDVAWDGFEFHLGTDGYAGVFPTHGGQACVWLFPKPGLAGTVVHAGADRLDVWLRALHATVPGLAHRVLSGRVVSPVRGATGLPNHVLQAVGPGWALVGDAGYHRDPITGHGMTDAFRDAELLADAADDVLRGAVPETLALAAYQSGRDRAIGEVFRLTREIGSLPSRAHFVELQSRLSRALEVEAAQLAARPVRAGAALSMC